MKKLCLLKKARKCKKSGRRCGSDKNSMQLSESEKTAIAQKLQKSKKKAGGVGVLTKTLCSFPKAKKQQSLRNFEKAKKRLAESEFWHELYVAFRKQKKDNRSKLSKRQKKRSESSLRQKLYVAFRKQKKAIAQSYRKCKKKSGRRCGSDKNSLELVHREFFGRFTPGARFFLFYYKNPKRLPLFFQFQKLL